MMMYVIMILMKIYKGAYIVSQNSSVSAQFLCKKIATH